MSIFFLKISVPKMALLEVIICYPVKLNRLILKKIIKIVATRCQTLRLECTKFDFPAGGAYSAPKTP